MSFTTSNVNKRRLLSLGRASDLIDTKTHSRHEEVHEERRIDTTISYKENLDISAQYLQDCIPTPENSNPRKRQHSEQDSTHPKADPPSKGKGLPPSHSQHRSQTPSAFYDQLSYTWLTKHALRELDRRIARLHSQPFSPSRQYTVESSTLPAPGKTKVSPPSAPKFLRKCSSTCLNDIKKFARHGGPDLSDLRGYPQGFMHSQDEALPSRQPSLRDRGRPSKQPRGSPPKQPRGRPRKRPLSPDSTETTTKTPKTSPYNRNFEQHLIDHGVYIAEYDYPDGRTLPEPNNFQEIQERLLKRRLSLSPSRFTDEEFKNFRRANTQSTKENKVLSVEVPLIEGGVRDGNCVSGQIPFTNLEALTDGTIVSGNPDRYYGARPEQLSRQIRDQLYRQIIPSTQDSLPMVPNFLMAAKGPDGQMSVVMRQACYDGALGARGMHHLQSYGHSEPIYDNNAYTVALIYLHGMLRLYTSHLGRSATPGGRSKYYMHQLRSFAITDSADAFRDAASAYRNARDWAEEKRNAFIEAANSKVPDLEETDTSAD